ncbi:hypothetical protein [Streptomyces avermitilis]|uniref:hypothetical protein n=1 Tax=Streptomyces avermitilis TaxID=33903 RepID=UPI00382CA12E
MTTPPAPNPQPHPYPQPNPHLQANPYAQPQANPYAQQGGHPQAPGYAAPGYGAPGYGAVPPQAGPQWGAPYGAGAYLSCKFCGGAPAVDVTFRAHRGLLILMSFQKLSGPMCATCGLGVQRAMTTQTLWQGWWSPFSLFLFTPFTLVWNLIARGKVKKLQPPPPGQHGQQVDPGEPVHRRGLAYVALVPVLWICFMIAQGLTQS